MTEYELMYLISENFSQSLEIWQFWSGVSFGYMALSHFAARQLNTFIIIFLSILYVAFSAFITFSMGDLWEMSKAQDALLQSLSQRSEGLSILGSAWQRTQDRAEIIPFMVAFFGTFLGALVYLPYRYYSGPHENT